MSSVQDYIGYISIVGGAASVGPVGQYSEFQGGSPKDFEYWCSDRLKAEGWRTKLTPPTGDQGVDIIAEKNGISVAIQCKMYSSSSVGNQAVQQVHAGASHHRTHYAAVITNSKYTNSAKQLSKSTGVILLNHNEIPEIYLRLLELKLARDSDGRSNWIR